MQIRVLNYILASLIVLGVVYLISAQNKKIVRVVEPKSYTVVFTKNGFVPSELQINKGDAVSFKNDQKEPSWPASDSHPMHSNYPGFDALRGLQGGESWLFTFNEPGNWSYHDHINVSFTGKIIVTDSNSKQLYSCSGTSEASLSCFGEELRATVRKDGVDAAFNLLAQKYDIGSVPAACHWSTHSIGDEVFREEERGKSPAFSSQTYYCGYGFYHGYLEAMLRANPDPEKQQSKIVAFCDAIDKQIGGEGRDNCYHGIGSGFTENPPDPKVWGNLAELVKPGLKICEQLFGQSREWEMCTTGVFAVPANFMSEHKYNFSFNLSDPFEFCAKLDERYHRACYGEFAAKMELLSQGDLSRIPQFLVNIKDPSLAKLVLNVGVATSLQSVVLKDVQTDYIYACRKFTIEYQPTCFDGVVWGLLYHGRLNEEQVKAMALCDSNLLAVKEKSFCYERLVARAKNMFSADKFNNICKVLPMEYQHYCQKNIEVTI